MRPILWGGLGIELHCDSGGVGVFYLLWGEPGRPIGVRRRSFQNGIKAVLRSRAQGKSYCIAKTGGVFYLLWGEPGLRRFFGGWDFLGGGGSLVKRVVGHSWG